MKHVETMPRKLRRLTPEPFARLLLELVTALHHAERVAVLWVDPDSAWFRFRPRVQCWTRTHNAWLYDGPYPVICHPPCGSWGMLWRQSRQPRTDGLMAMELVHRWGGVIEQPVGSQLFAIAGDGRPLIRINQGDYGHVGRKPTLLYVV